jgi:tryptophan halogenase
MSKINSVTIVGDGVCGWLTAASLLAMFGRRVAVTLIGSHRRPDTAWANRSTGALSPLLALLGISEDDFMLECDATFRCGANYVGWGARGGSAVVPLGDPGEASITFLPTLTVPVLGRGFTPLDVWGRSWAKGHALPFVEARESLRVFFARDLSPKREPGLKRYEQAPPYGFHFDPARLEDLVRERATSFGAVHLTEKIARAHFDERGRVTSVTTDSGRSLVSDLYVDCSEDPASPMRGAVGGSAARARDTALLDEYVSVRIDRDEQSAVPTTTTMRRLSSGWMQSVPLGSAMVHQYSFSARHVDRNDALEELGRALGISLLDVEHTHGRAVQGEERSPWSENRIVIGRGASAFGDPAASYWLEVAHQIGSLFVHLPSKDGPAEFAEAHNVSVAALADVVHDHLAAHFVHSSPLETPFWSAARTAVRPSESLSARVAAYTSGVASQSSFGRSASRGELPDGFFDRWQHAVLLGAFGVGPKSYPALLDHLDLEPWAQYLRQQKLTAERMVRELPTHAAYIAAMKKVAPV